MSYIEQALARGAALWRKREKTLRERLAQGVPAETEEKETLRAGEETETARLRRKLYGRADGKAAELPAPDGKAAETEAGRAAGARRSGSAAEEESAAAWIAEELEKGAAERFFAAAREEETLLRAAAQEDGGTEAFSKSLERDARRYDGGFLFY